MAGGFTVTLRSGAAFAAGAGENLLAAARRAHWLVRYGCRNGNCEACAATLLSGRVLQRGTAVDAAGGPQPILLCLSRAASDLIIDLPGNPRHGSPGQARRCYARLTAAEAVGPDHWRWRFTLPAGRLPPARAGQYLALELPGDGLRRAEIEGLQQRTLCAHGDRPLPLAVGDHLYLSYPLGFCCGDPEPPPLVLWQPGRALQAQLLGSALPGAALLECGDDPPPLPAQHFTAILACADTATAQRWYQALLNAGTAFDEFRCDEAVWRRWRVRRQDDHGTRFSVAEGLSEATARARAAELEARGHKQLYWAEPF